MKNLISNYHVVKVPCEGPRKHWKKKGNVESNVTEQATPLKQQP